MTDAEKLTKDVTVRNGSSAQVRREDMMTGSSIYAMKSSLVLSMFIIVISITSMT